jgi:hypothetical protein
VILRVNDRGPFYSDRIIDLSYAAAKKLGYAEIGTAHVRVEGIDPQQWWAQRGQTAPMMLKEPQVAQTQRSRPAPGASSNGPAAAAACGAGGAGAGSGNNVPAATAAVPAGGRFANPDAAELLRSKLSTMVSAPVFISSIVRNQQTLHRVRLGPIGSRVRSSKHKTASAWPTWGRPSWSQLTDVEWLAWPQPNCRFCHELPGAPMYNDGFCPQRHKAARSRARPPAIKLD